MGSSLPLTGIGAYLGCPVQRTVDLVIKEFNEAGGIVINGITYLIDMTWYDDQYDPVKGRTNVEKLIYEDKVEFLIGLFGTTFAASSRFINESQVLVTTTASGGSDIINPDRPYVFRAYQGSVERAYPVMEWIIENYSRTQRRSQNPERHFFLHARPTPLRCDIVIPSLVGRLGGFNGIMRRL